MSLERCNQAVVAKCLPAFVATVRDPVRVETETIAGLKVNTALDVDVVGHNPEQESAGREFCAFLRCTGVPERERMSGIRISESPRLPFENAVERGDETFVCHPL